MITIENSPMVIWGSPKHWRTTAPVGSHGYAGRFAAHGWRVLFISSPVTPLHRLLAADERIYRERLAIHREGGRWEEAGRLWDYVPWSLAPSKQFPAWWLRLSFGSFQRALKKAGIAAAPSIVWIDNPEFGELFTRYPLAKRVLRIADRNQGLKGFNGRLMREQEKLVEKADLVVVTSFSLEREYREKGVKRLLRVPNGVNLEKFQAPAACATPPDLRGISAPIAIFVGMIDHWFDVDLLERSAAYLPDVSFVLIGHAGIDTSRLARRKNIHLLGERPPHMVPAYLQHAAVGIIPFEQSPFSDAINPVKYYEYTAAGLGVVATDTLEFRELGEPVLLARNAEEFAARISSVLQAGPADKERLKRHAASMSWECRWATIMEGLYPEGVATVGRR